MYKYIYIYICIYIYIYTYRCLYMRCIYQDVHISRDTLKLCGLEVTISQSSYLTN